ncbi:MAG: helix-turn-helix domain-containing protein [Terriglobales bacterium]
MNDTREVIRCPKCTLNQFKTASQKCRRCRFSLAPEPEPIQPKAAAVPPPVLTGSRLTLDTALAAVLIYARQRSGLSQRDVALRMRVPRTYISKFENGKATPTIASLYKIAAAIGVSPQRLVLMADVAAGRGIPDFGSSLKHSSSPVLAAAVHTPSASRATFA